MCLEIHRKRIIVIVARESTITVLKKGNRTGSTGSRNPGDKTEKR